MKLTGKAKEDFEIWMFGSKEQNSYSEMFYIMPMQYQLCSYVEWFDSVGINVTILVCHDLKFDVYINTKEKRISGCQFNETRQEATEKAIEKANEIYNTK